MAKFILILWVLNLLSYIHIKKLIKENYPEIHDFLFAKSLTEHSVDYSMRFIRFSFGGSQWAVILNGKVLFWLQINRILNIGFYLLIFGIAGYFIIGLLVLALFG